MTTLLARSQDARRCDAKCYGATGGDCACICGGLLHGKGKAEAQKEAPNVIRFAGPGPRLGLVAHRAGRVAVMLQLWSRGMSWLQGTRYVARDAGRNNSSLVSTAEVGGSR